MQAGSDSRPIRRCDNSGPMTIGYRNPKRSNVLRFVLSSTFRRVRLQNE